MSKPKVIQINTDNETIEAAISILKNRLRVPGEPLTNAEAVKQFLILKLGEYTEERFSVIFLDNRHRLITYKEMFRGTVDGASVYPREIAKEALQLHACAVILAHNHPSGYLEPSQADRTVTKQISDALGLIEVRVLDHVIVGGADAISFAERGLI